MRHINELVLAPGCARLAHHITVYGSSRHHHIRSCCLYRLPWEHFLLWQWQCTRSCLPVFGNWQFGVVIITYPEDVNYNEAVVTALNKTGHVFAQPANLCSISYHDYNSNEPKWQWKYTFFVIWNLYFQHWDQISNIFHQHSRMYKCIPGAIFSSHWAEYIYEVL